MSNDLALKIAMALLGAAFGAGSAAVVARNASRDLKGLSKRTMSIIAMLEQPEWADTEEKQRQIANLLNPYK